MDYGIYSEFRNKILEYYQKQNLIHVYDNTETNNMV